MLIRSPIIAVLGHVDHGKCISGDTLIPLPDGRIMRADELYEMLTSDKKGEWCGDGWVTDISNENAKLYSFSKECEIVEAGVSHVWKRQTQSLLSVMLSDGSAIKATPEHKFFVVNEAGGISEKEGRFLKEGEFVLTPRYTKNRTQRARAEKRFFERLSAMEGFVARIDDEDFTSGMHGLYLSNPADFPAGFRDCLSNGRFQMAELRTAGGVLGCGFVKHHGLILRTSSAIPSAKLKEPVASDIDGFRRKPHPDSVGCAPPCQRTTHRSLYPQNGAPFSWTTEAMPIGEQHWLPRTRGASVRKMTELKNSTHKWRAGHTGPWLPVPQLRDELGYALGLLFGDGVGGVAKLCKNDPEILSAYADAMKKAFGVQVVVRRERTVTAAIHRGGRTLNRMLNEIFDFPARQKSRTIRIPDLVKTGDDSLLANFIAGVFDTDGYASNQGALEITSASRLFVEDLSLALLRFGIRAAYYSKNGYYSLRISGIEDIEKFRRAIPIRSLKKGARLERFLKKARTNRNSDISPISGASIREIRNLPGLAKMEVGIPYQGKYEEYPFVSRAYLSSFKENLTRLLSSAEYRNALKKKIRLLKSLKCRPLSSKEAAAESGLPWVWTVNQLRSFYSDGLVKMKNGQFSLTATGADFCANSGKCRALVRARLQNISRFCSGSDVQAVRISEIVHAESKDYVYDFTVPEHHNFVADRIFAHNTSLLDAVRGTGVAGKEAGGITQMIGASYVARENIEAVSKPVAERMKIKLMVPGILFIDTPGHEAFTNLRERGGSIADMAIVVVDIAQGFQPQTIESIRILKNAKTPFIIAANKVDLVDRWKSQATESFLESLAKQSESTQNNVDERIYGLMGKLSEYGFDSERFDRVKNFTKQVGIVPVSAKTGEGLAELLLLIAGLSQKFLEKELHVDPESPAKGSVMEVKEEKGLGPTVDVIIYDGVLVEGDEIVFLSRAGVKKTKIRALLEPNIRGAKEKFRKAERLVAAAGVKIAAPGLEDAVSGSPLIVAKNYEKDRKEIEAHMKGIIFESAGLGVVVKADSLGSVEAIVKLLRDANVPVKAANVGNVTKGDALLAATVAAQDKYLGAVLAFNVQVLPDAKTAGDEGGAQIIYSNIVYQLLDRYEEWKAEEREREKKQVFEKMSWPCRIRALPNCFFRVSKPAIFGVEVLAGKLRPHVRLMNLDGRVLGEVKTIQKEKESLAEAKKGTQVAISVDEIILGSDVREGDALLVYITKAELEKWKKKSDALSDEEKEIVSEIEALISVVF